ncbi:hypothetical protein DSL72_007208 [Monilinia vaccinii-corymbosi]|uniref:Peroxidase n=1 Tax=Monilinia vaccinii-corymbosi TaxID=61207 RepID=A0A8A3PMC8_9HELO|nr:hypothetical protein DSL72_007208 [Monilinia vaccinii-corymbosi]
MKAISFTGMALLPVLSVNAAYTWPSKYDQIEDILYAQKGWLQYGVRDAVTPCSFSSAGEGRQTAAEWIRTAYQDMSTHDIETGLGGLDASIAFELGRAENPGEAFNGTLGVMNNYHSIKASMADLIALSVVVASMSCGGPIIPFRAGRIDAIQAGLPGAPEPQQDLATHTALFAKQGFNTSDMITMVACGHVLGGVHGADYPEITGNASEANYERFNSKSQRFTNTIVTEYLADNSSNVLLVGKNDTFNSDKRIFGADDNKTMNALADPTNFKTKCSDIFARMIDTVPKSVTLSDVITPIDIKPYKIAVSLGANGTLEFSGYIRVRTTHRQDSKLTVSIQYRDRQNTTTTVLDAPRERYKLGESYGFDDETFGWFGFKSVLSPASGVSSFDVIIHTTDAPDQIHTNNGLGFPTPDEILYQPAQSCLPPDAAGLYNLTIAAAVRADRVDSPVFFDWVYKRTIPGVAMKALEVQRITMKKRSEEIGGYYLFTGYKTYDVSQGDTTFDLVLGEGDDATKVEFLSTGDMGRVCGAFP